MPWNPGKQWQMPELHSPLPWQLRGHSCTESVRMTKWNRERGGRGETEFDGKHQSIRLNWQHSFFKMLHIKPRRREFHSCAHFKSVMPLFKIPRVPFQCIFQRESFESAIPWDFIHASLVCTLPENKHVQGHVVVRSSSLSSRVLVVYASLWPHQGH